MKLYYAFLCSMAMIFAACASNSAPMYIQNSSDYTSFDIDYHDIDNVVKKFTQSLIKSKFIQKHKKDKKAIIAISDVINLTKEHIDTEFLSRKIIRSLNDYEQIILTNAIAGSGSKKDNLIENSRKLLNDENFNQHSTREKGRLIAPQYSLTGKIIKKTKNIGDNQRVDYQFLFVINDLDSGLELWSDEVIIMKVIQKEQVKHYSTINTESQKDEIKAYKIKPTKQAKKGIFGAILEADVGTGSGNANMQPIPYTFSPKSEGSIYIDDNEILSIYPYLLRAGLFYKRDSGIYIEGSFLYGGYNAKIESYFIDCVRNDSRHCYMSNTNMQDITFSHRLMGWGARLGYNYTSPEFSLIGYVGGGQLIDKGSNMKINQITRIRNISLENTYPFWEIGAMMTYKDKFFIDISYRHILDIDTSKSWATIGSLNLGVGLMFSSRLFE